MNRQTDLLWSVGLVLLILAALAIDGYLAGGY